MKTIALKDKMDSIFIYTLIAFILTLPYSTNSATVGTFSILLALITFANKQSTTAVKTIIHDHTIKVLFIFILFTYVSTLWSNSPVFFNGDLHTNLGRFKYYFLIIPAIYLSNISKQDINKLFIAIALAPALSIIIYYTNYLGITSIFATQNMDDTLVLHHYLIQNFFIVFSILYLYIGIFQSIKTNNHRKLFIYVPLLLIASISLFIDERTESRLMDLAFILIIITVPFYFVPKKIYIPLLITLLSLSALLVSSQPSFNRGINSFKKAIESNVYTDSWGHRTGYILTGLEIFAEHPIIGRGINDITEPINNKAKEKPEYFKGEHLRHFHNEHINILVASGLIGYLLLLYFLLTLFKLKLKSTNVYIFKNTSIIILLFIMMGEHYLSFKSTTNFFAVLVALFTKLYSLEKRDS